MFGALQLWSIISDETDRDLNKKMHQTISRFTEIGNYLSTSHAVIIAFVKWTASKKNEMY